MVGHIVMLSELVSRVTIDGPRSYTKSCEICKNRLYIKKTKKTNLGFYYIQRYIFLWIILIKLWFFPLKKITCWGVIEFFYMNLLIIIILIGSILIILKEEICKVELLNYT